MKKKLIGGLVLSLGLMSVAVSAATNTPAEIVSSLTGKSVEVVRSERAKNNTSYGTMAKEAGKLDEFKKANLDRKKELLAQRVKDKQITQAQADTIIKNMQDRQASCDGSGSNKNDNHQENGLGNGHGSGQGNGQGDGHGKRIH